MPVFNPPACEYDSADMVAFGKFASLSYTMRRLPIQTKRKIIKVAKKNPNREVGAIQLHKDKRKFTLYCINTRWRPGSYSPQFLRM